MDTKLIVETCRDTGRPVINIPRQAMWDLAEYLAAQKVRVTFSYRASQFVVFFHCVDHAEAQRIVDAWSAASHADEDAEPEAKRHRLAEWVVGKSKFPLGKGR